MKETELRVDGIGGNMFTPEGKGPFPAVIFFHGLGSSKRNYIPMAETLGNQGIVAVAFDFRPSPLDQTPLEIINDGKKVLDFLLSQNVDKKRIGMQGTSFGAYVAVKLLRDYDFVKSVVLRVPAALSDKDLNIKLSARIAGYFENRENWIESSVYDNISKFAGQLLVIRSEMDQQIPKECVNKYYDVAVSTKERKLYVQKNAGHELSNNPAGLKEFQKITVDWFLETL